MRKIAQSSPALSRITAPSGYAAGGALLYAASTVDGRRAAALGLAGGALIFLAVLVDLVVDDQVERAVAKALSQPRADKGAGSAGRIENGAAANGCRLHPLGCTAGLQVPCSLCRARPATAHDNLCPSCRQVVDNEVAKIGDLEAARRRQLRDTVRDVELRPRRQLDVVDGRVVVAAKRANLGDGSSCCPRDDDDAA